MDLQQDNEADEGWFRLSPDSPSYGVRDKHYYLAHLQMPICNMDQTRRSGKVMEARDWMATPRLDECMRCWHTARTRAIRLQEGEKAS